MTAMTWTVTNVASGANEFITFDNFDIALTDGNSVVTDIDNMTIHGQPCRHHRDAQLLRRVGVRAPAAEPDQRHVLQEHQPGSGHGRSGDHHHRAGRFRCEWRRGRQHGGTGRRHDRAYHAGQRRADAGRHRARPDLHRGRRGCRHLQRRDGLDDRGRPDLHLDDADGEQRHRRRQRDPQFRRLARRADQRQFGRHRRPTG